ncbi:hypothetical protein NTR1_52 [Nocardia phage NTR1]|nr:hypothetical protein NTR1_52 [Nocardia phage NTR1]
MAQVCVSQNLGIGGGILSIEPHSIPHHVFDQTYNSVGDGSFGAQTTLPGKLMIDSGIQTWTNPSPMPARVLLRVQRAYRNWQVSNPNAVQIRDRYTYAIGGADPRVPDVSSVYNGQSGSAMDVGAQFNGTPYIGVYWEWEDGTLIEDWLGPIPPGADLKIWYRCNLWTPPPWSNNANNNSPQHSASVRSTRIQMIAFPTQDSTVVG